MKKMLKRITALFFAILLLQAPIAALAEEGVSEPLTAPEADGTLSDMAEEINETLPVSEEAMPAESAGEDDYLLLNVGSFLYGLNSKGQIVAGREVSIRFIQLIARNDFLYEKVMAGAEVTVGLRDGYEGETTVLTPDEDGTIRFTLPAEMGSHTFFFTVTVAETGEVYESNVGFTVNSNPWVTLTIKIEGQGTVTADRYEGQAGETIELFITPAEG